MSSNTVESFLFRLQSDPGFLQRFRESPESTMGNFPFSPQEVNDLLSWNVRALFDRGVNGMLLLVGYTAVHGQQGVPVYLKSMNATSSIES